MSGPLILYPAATVSSLAANGQLAIEATSNYQLKLMFRGSDGVIPDSRADAGMSGHAAFRRQPVPGEMAIRHTTVTLPAPIRGIIENENWAYTKPGCATILDNWFPTQKGLRLRGGTERWLTLPDPVEIVRSGFSTSAAQCSACSPLPPRGCSTCRLPTAPRWSLVSARRLTVTTARRSSPTRAAIGCSPSTTAATLCGATTAPRGRI